MTTFLLCWYALGWAATGVYCTQFKKLTLAELVLNLLGGGIMFLIHCAAWCERHGSTPIVWRKK